MGRRSESRAKGVGNANEEEMDSFWSKNTVPASLIELCFFVQERREEDKTAEALRAEA